MDRLLLFENSTAPLYISGLLKSGSAVFKLDFYAEDDRGMARDFKLPRCRGQKIVLFVARPMPFLHLSDVDGTALASFWSEEHNPMMLGPDLIIDRDGVFKLTVGAAMELFIAVGCPEKLGINDVKCACGLVELKGGDARHNIMP